MSHQSKLLDNSGLSPQKSTGKTHRQYYPSDHTRLALSSELTSIPLDNSIPPSPDRSSSWSRFLAMAGLPCLISVAAIDPGNLEVDLQAGALLQYRLIWAVLLSSIVGFVLQTLAAHVTILTGEHLAEACARSYRRHRVLSRAIFVFAELSIVAFDVAEVVGTAFALELLFRWPLWLGMLVSGLDTMLVLYLQRHGLSKVEIIIEGMLLILVICLFYEFVLSRPRFPAILEGTFVPSVGPDHLQGAILAVGILGSVIMSHNLYLHSWLLKQRGDYFTDASEESKRAACRYATIESAVIFAATFLVNACVMCVAAVLPISSTIGLRNAAALLRNVLRSEWAATAWGAALLASGHAATVTGSLASQAVCEGFLGVREGNSPAGLVLATRAVAIVPALGVALMVGGEGTDKLIVLSQVVVSLGIPFAVVPIFKVLPATSGRDWLLWGGYLAFIAVVASNLFAMVDIGRQVAEELGATAFKWLMAAGIMVCAVTAMLVITPVDDGDDDMVRGTGVEGRKLLGDQRPQTYS